ncbi:MAG: IclR family transcriptional regulator [Candidatus Limnocylindria bacterium]
MSTALDRPPEEAGEDSSFARGLRVLLTVADRGEIRADELSALLDTPISTIYRYLRTLTEFGFTERHGAGYRLGARLVIESGETVTAAALIQAAGPVLDDLARRTGETAVISRRVGLAAMRLHQVESAQPLRVSLDPGTSSPLHAGALSKVLLAFAPIDIRETVLRSDLVRLTASTPDAARLPAELDAIAATGLAVSEGESIRGSVAVAAPVMGPDGILAAIGVIGPAARCGRRWRSLVVGLLPGAARAVAEALDPPREPGTIG